MFIQSVKHHVNFLLDPYLQEHGGVGAVDAEGDVQHIEFTTEDGQKLRFVTTPDVNQLQLVADLMSAHMPQVSFSLFLKVSTRQW